MPKLSDGPSAPTLVEFPVVGLGASAGGVTALHQFFEALPATTGAAYVVLLHLPPEHTSHLDAVLQGATSMPVVPVTAGTTIERNHVYVVPPACAVTICDGQLATEPLASARGVVASIDGLLRSVADAANERAVAIVLSGAGSDGSVGIKRIKERGGITMVQNPDEAEHDGMPRAAIATGLVDFTLGASEMPQRLLDLWTQEGRVRISQPDSPAEDADEDEDDGDPFSERNLRALREITIVLRARTGHDFRHYKRATLLRRIERRLTINGLSDLQQYRDFLHLHPDETQALLQDLLVSTTHFFRDRDAFEALRVNVLPAIFSRRGADDPVRVWAAGCATGEEAYSLAMLLHEASANTTGRVPFQVFATDIDDRAIEVARQGVYAQAALADVDAARVKRYFFKCDGGYRIKKELRDRVLFAVHNVLRDPPFSRLDLICCRNLLVYLDRSAQTESLQAFRFALNQGGYLFLGPSETADAAARLFTCIDKQARIFCHELPPVRAAKTSAPTHAEHGAALARALDASAKKRRFSFGDLHGRLLEEHALPSVLVNRSSEIVHVSDRAGRFFAICRWRTLAQRARGDPSRTQKRIAPSDLHGAAKQASHRYPIRPLLARRRPVRGPDDRARGARRRGERRVHFDFVR